MITPYGNRLLVKILPGVGKTESGVIIPGIPEENVVRGTVLDSGNEQKAIQAGTTVMFAKETGFRFQQGSEWWAVIDEKDILALVNY